MAYICTRNGKCRECPHYGYDPESGRNACFAQSDGGNDNIEPEDVIDSLTNIVEFICSHPRSNVVLSKETQNKILELYSKAINIVSKRETEVI